MDYEGLGRAIGLLVAEKQRQYGDSAGSAGEIVGVLYPDGIPPHAYGRALLVVRILDKLSRIAQQGPDGADLGGEDPWRDIAGYAILALAQAQEASK